MKKLVVVINGAGGVGKDTLCSFAAQEYKVRNISSVDPIKELAKQAGWTGEKSDRARKMLSDLKRLFTEYNDLPLRYIREQYEQFLQSEEQVMFVHIREPEEIARFVETAPEQIKTLLVTNSNRETAVYGNASDDNVTQYQYDAVYDNRHSLEQTKQIFMDFFQNWFIEKAFEK